VTFTASVNLDEAAARALADALGEESVLAGCAVDLGETAAGWEVVVYFEAGPDRTARTALARAARRALGARAPAFAIAALPETDWVARSLAGLASVRAGRFLIHGRHDRDSRRANDIAIEIEAGQAFGTGHHGTTRGCLLAVDAIARTRRVASAIDVGTGSGVLAIAIARATKARVLASDSDPIAVAIARDNARLNGVGDRVRVIHAAGLGRREFAAAAPADLIVANILAGPLVALAPGVAARLAPGGTAVLSGLLPAQRARVVAAYRSLGLVLIRTFVLDGWMTVVMRKPSRPVERRLPRL